MVKVLDKRMESGAQMHLRLLSCNLPGRGKLGLGYVHMEGIHCCFFTSDLCVEDLQCLTFDFKNLIHKLLKKFARKLFRDVDSPYCLQ